MRSTKSTTSNTSRLSLNNPVLLIKLFLSFYIQLSVCSPLRKHLPKQYNSVIHARIGESINISCWFDPNSMYTNGRLRHPNYMSNDDLDDLSNNRRLFQKRNVRLLTRREANMNSNRNRIGGGDHFGRTGTSNDRLSFTSRFRDDSDNHYKASLFDAENRDDDTWAQAHASKPAIKYELDWYFWDKDGKFKIISYGNLTASNFKYKTFVNREELSEVLRAAAASMHHHNHHNQHHSSNNMAAAPSSASALYSQTSSRSSNPNSRYVYTYYLNALIESEQDEGVYQCINPDSPNFVLRNVTVLIARNTAINRTKTNFFDHLTLLMFLCLSYYCVFFTRTDFL